RENQTGVRSTTTSADPATCVPDVTRDVVCMERLHMQVRVALRMHTFATCSTHETQPTPPSKGTS
ncbi:MAG TPA: hypothetical protein VLD39_17055, partial [Gammaproteobacteria bacterium]|nr:hypothetical protein [Gammaproteobacteria bacterium]